MWVISASLASEIEFGIGGCEPPQPNSAARSMTWRRFAFLIMFGTGHLEALWKQEGE
jgi:hypothetical protein